MEIPHPSKFVKPGDNIQKGDIVRIRDEGKYRDSQYGPQLDVQLELADGTLKSYTPNSQTIINLRNAFGTNSKNWIDKNLKAWVWEEMAKTGKNKGTMVMRLILTQLSASHRLELMTISI